jgi:hypothetical protein
VNVLREVLTHYSASSSTSAIYRYYRSEYVPRREVLTSCSASNTTSAIYRYYRSEYVPRRELLTSCFASSTTSAIYRYYRSESARKRSTYALLRQQHYISHLPLLQKRICSGREVLTHYSASSTTSAIYRYYRSESDSGREVLTSCSASSTTLAIYRYRSEYVPGREALTPYSASSTTLATYRYYRSESVRKRGTYVLVRQQHYVSHLPLLQERICSEEKYLRTVPPAALRQPSTATTGASLLRKRSTYTLFRQYHYVSHL